MIGQWLPQRPGVTSWLLGLCINIRDRPPTIGFLRGRGNPGAPSTQKMNYHFHGMQMGLPSVGGQPAASWTINCFIETRPHCGSERHCSTKEEASSLC